MIKTICIVACFVGMAIALIYANACYAQGIPSDAKGVEIGDEHVLIIVTASGTRGQVDVPVVVTDPQGKRIGVDPKTGERLEDEFNASYSAASIWDEEKKKYVPFCTGPVDSTEETEFLLQTDPKFKEEFEEGTVCKTEVAFNLLPGKYTIETIGKELTAYNLMISISRVVEGQPEEPFIGFAKKGTPTPKSRISPKSASFNFDGIIDRGLTSKFQFVYNSDPTANPGTGVRVATPSSLKQDITLSRKIGWIDNDGIMKSLLAKADAIEASIAKGNKTATKNQLNAFINEVNAQKGKHISDKAIKILLEDAQYLLESL